MFDIESAADFYRMLVEDFDDFMANQASSRHALHCAITGYHLHEWVWGDWLPRDVGTLAKLGIRDRKGFLVWIDRACPWFPVVQALTNGTKHFIRKRDFESSRVAGFGQGPYGVGPHGHAYLLLDFGEAAFEHRYRPAVDLLEVVVRFWRDFFNTYRPQMNVTPSKHHVD